MDNCTRHAFTDGECVHAGCIGCPGRAERRLIELVTVNRAAQWRLAMIPATIVAIGVLAMVAMVAPERFSAVVVENQESAR